MAPETLPPFPVPGYSPVNPAPVPGACSGHRCRRRATHEVAGAAGPEGGDLRPTDPAQVTIVRPFCAACCARFMRHAGAGYAAGPARADSFERFARGDAEVAW